MRKTSQNTYREREGLEPLDTILAREKGAQSLYNAHYVAFLPESYTVPDLFCLTYTALSERQKDGWRRMWDLLQRTEGIDL